MKLLRSLVILDLETTGTWIDKDKIIEIGMVKASPDGTHEEFHTRVNPGMPIPAAVSALTGITDEDVKDAPTFASIAPKVVEFIGDADLGGFNVERFDAPLLARELSDAGITFDSRGRTIYDAQKVYHLHEKRDLSAAYNFYCGKPLVDAHSAMADVNATLEILKEQIKRHCQGEECVEALKAFDYRPSAEFFDKDKKFRWWNGELYMMFGKYARTEPLRVIAKKDPGYLHWIIEKDFSDDVKAMVQEVLSGRHPQQTP